MKRIAILFVVVGACASLCVSQEPPKQSSTEKEHKLLQRLVGEWEGAADVETAPGQPKVKVTTNEVISTIGSLWVVSKCNGKMGDIEMESMMTLGYDPVKKKIIGTWVDSFQNHLWIYNGSFDKSGNVLTLEAKGPNMMKPGETANYRDVLELKGDDTKVLTSQMQQEDGTWLEFMTIEYKRKK